ncbi:MAG: LamG domain-containing protein [Planctomycetota bacterium]|jgi:hypothetical protein
MPATHPRSAAALLAASVLALALAPASCAEAAEPAPGNAYRGKMLEMTDDEADPVKVWDSKGETVLAPFQLTKKGLALLDGEFSLRLEGGRYSTAGAEEHLAANLRNAGGELTLSAYVYPATLEKKARGCIVGYAPAGGGFLFALTQGGGKLSFTIAAPKPVEIALGKLDSTKPFHLALTVSRREIVFYRNGQKAGAHPGIDGDFSAWKPGRLYFGNDEKGTCPWHGRVELAAVHNRALAAGEVAKAAKSVLELIADRDPVERIELVGKLVERSTYRMPWGENTYREALSECDYEVVKVLRGKYGGKKIRVAELMFVDRIFLTASRKKVGEEYRLVVEELDGNLRMSKVERGLLEPDIDLILYVETGPLEALPADQQPRPPEKKEKRK